MPVVLRKICEAPEARFPAADWSDFAPGAPGPGYLSVPIAYELVGDLCEPLTVGCQIRIFRTVRNGVVHAGKFVSSPVQEIGTGWVRTENSVYQFHILPP